MSLHTLKKSDKNMFCCHIVVVSAKTILIALVRTEISIKPFSHMKSGQCHTCSIQQEIVHVRRVLTWGAWSGWFWQGVPGLRMQEARCDVKGILQKI